MSSSAIALIKTGALKIDYRAEPELDKIIPI
jgi:hypothetical protein